MYTPNNLVKMGKGDRILQVCYDEYRKIEFTPKDIVVFCDIDRCNDKKLNRIKWIHSKIKKSGSMILNDPNLVLRRYDLCKLLYHAHDNDFRIFRLDELESVKLRFPVFLRHEFYHNGNMSPLIYSNHELTESIKQLPNKTDIIVSEYTDTRDSVFKHHHKYGAFIFNDKIIPRHFYASQEWMIKSRQNVPNISEEENENYIRTNPHEEVLKNIFQMSKIEYGRIDYSITSNGFQVFEINTNPLLSNHNAANSKSSIAMKDKRFIHSLLECLNQSLDERESLLA